jgi:hypothetical protein
MKDTWATGKVEKGRKGNIGEERREKEPTVSRKKNTTLSKSTCCFIKESLTSII